MSDSKYHIDNNKLDYCFLKKGCGVMFINTPKNASTSIRNSLGFDQYQIYDKLTNPDDYKKFIILRDPIERAVSSYLEIRKLRGDGPSSTSRSLPWYKIANPIESFKQFLEDISGGNFYDGHSFPQYKCIEDKGLTIEDIDDVLLFERLPEDFAKLVSKYSLKGALKHSNKSDGGTKKQILDYVLGDEDTKNKIIELYQIDYDLYTKEKEK